MATMVTLTTWSTWLNIDLIMAILLVFNVLPIEFCTRVNSMIPKFNAKTYDFSSILIVLDAHRMSTS